MKRLFTCLFSFIFLWMLFLHAQVVFAATTNKIEVGPIQVEVPRGTNKKFLVQFTISGDGLSQPANEVYTGENNCTAPDPFTGIGTGIQDIDLICTDVIKVPSNINASSNPYNIKITKINLVKADGTLDEVTPLQCFEGNCNIVGTGVNSSINQEIGRIKFRSTQTKIPAPILTAAPESIGLTSQSEVKVTNLDSQGVYGITLYDSRERQRGNSMGASTFQIKDDGTCTFTKNDLAIQCSKTTGTNFSEGIFTFKPPNIQNPAGDLTYIVQLTVRDKSSINAKPLFEPTVNISVVTGVKASDFNVTVKTTPILPNKDQKIAVTVSNTKAGQKYSAKLTTSLGDVDIIDPITSSTNGDLNFSFDSKKGGQFLFKGPGSYRLVITEEGTNRKGETIINVESDKDAEGNIKRIAENCRDKNNCTKAAGVICDINDTEAPKKGEIVTPSPGQEGILTAIGCIPTDPKMFLEKSLPVAFGASGGVAFLLMIMGAFQMITSAGNPDNVKKGREQFNSAIIGLIFILFSVLLLEVVGFNILNIPGFGR